MGAGLRGVSQERKKRKKVVDPETIAYYKSLFKKHLEGKTLSEELVEYVVNHPNKWLRNVFRHYIQYLYYLRRIPPRPTDGSWRSYPVGATGSTLGHTQ